MPLCFDGGKEKKMKTTISAWGGVPLHFQRKLSIHTKKGRRGAGTKQDSKYSHTQNQRPKGTLKPLLLGDITREIEQPEGHRKRAKAGRK